MSNSSSVFRQGPLTLHLGDNLTALKAYPPNSIHAVIIDGPYGLNSKEYDIEQLVQHYQKGQSYRLGGKGIGGMSWDSDLPSLELAKELFRVLKPGGFLVCFAGSRTYDILSLTFRWGGFRIKDQLIWAYASGVPKGKWLEKLAGDEEQRKKLAGLNSTLKPAFEPIVLAQKPIEEGETIVSNSLKHGTGALNIGAVKVMTSLGAEKYPANILTDGSKVVEKAFYGGAGFFNACPTNVLDSLFNPILFYSKAQATDREFALDKFDSLRTREGLFDGDSVAGKNTHLTVKPIALMRHLVRLLSKPGDVILDCFAGSGTTLIAALLEGRECVGVELMPEYFDIAKARSVRTIELMTEFNTTDPEKLILEIELSQLTNLLEKVANKLIMQPSNKELQREFEALDSKMRKTRVALKRLSSSRKSVAA